MESPSDLQRLLRLKRYESPGEDFVENFLADFQRRQRAELMKRSALSLGWERLQTAMAQWLSPRWAQYATAAAMLLLAGWVGAWISTGAQTTNSASAVAAAGNTAPMEKPQFLLNIDSQWINDVKDHQRLDPEDLLLSKHFQTPAMIEASSSVPDEGMAKAAMPVSLELPTLAEPSR